MRLNRSGSTCHDSQMNRARQAWRSARPRRFGFFQQLLEPIELTLDLQPKVLGQVTPLPSPQGSETLASVALRGVVAGDPLREEQPLDPVAVLDALLQQHLALASNPAPILLRRRRHAQHGA